MENIITIKTLPKLNHDKESSSYSYAQKYQDNLFFVESENKYYFFKKAKATPFDIELLDVIDMIANSQINNDSISNIEDAVVDTEDRLGKLDINFADLEKKVEPLNNIKKTIHDIAKNYVDSFEDDIMSKIRAMKDQATTSEDGKTSGLTIGKLMALKECGFKSKEIVDLAQFIN